MKTKYLITGGTGTLGQSLIKKLINDPNVEKIKSLSNSELRISNSLVKDSKIKYILGDVSNLETVLMASKNVDVIIHLAAIKHIDIAEENPIQTIETNVTGTINVVKAAKLNDVSKLAFVSTDKASASNTIYGKSKNVAEKVITLSSTQENKMSSFRFGNMFNSAGSVFHTWREQAEKGESLSLTHEDMSRFFISPEEVAGFILQRLNNLEGGEIFIPKMKSYKILDIAKAIAGDNYKIIGLRDKETILEYLINKNEQGELIENDTFYIIKPGNNELIDIKSDEKHFLDSGSNFIKIFKI